MTDTVPFAAPQFTLPAMQADETTVEVSSDALKGAPYVLFFYPRDDTSGCTKENEAFTALLPEFEALGVKVFGISKDSLASHAKFMKKKALTVPLLSDEDSDLSERYAAFKEKKMYGKTFMGIERSTFLVDGAGQVVKAWRKVKVPGHAEEVLEAAKAL